MTRIGLILAVAAGVAVARPIPERVRSASDVVVNRQTSSASIPRWVIDRTKCFAALRVVKAGLMWGGQGSTGMVSCRTANNRWSAPSFFSVDGVTFGLQIGIQILETVMAFVTDFARDVLNHANFQVGAELSFAAGPVGGGGGPGEMPNAHILSYQKAVGLFAGATINGFVLSHNPRFNRQAYGSDITPVELLKTDGDSTVEVVQPFIETMNRYLPAN